MRSRAYLHKYLHKYTHTQTRIEQLQMRQHFALQAYICICTYVSKHVSMSACMLADLPSLYVVGTLTATDCHCQCQSQSQSQCHCHCYNTLPPLLLPLPPLSLSLHFAVTMAATDLALATLHTTISLSHCSALRAPPAFNTGAWLVRRC